MAYDATKDKLVKEIGICEGNIRVAIFTYNDGPEKVVVQEKDTVKLGTEEKEVWKNLKGRHTKEVYTDIAKAVLNIIGE